MKVNNGEYTIEILKAEYDAYFKKGFRSGCVNKEVYLKL